MEEEFISHYGVKRRSGRYPWGSGENPYQGDQVRNKRDFDKGRVITKKRKLEDKLDKMLDRSLKSSGGPIQTWKNENAQDQVKREIARLGIRWLADEYNIYDKRVSDLAGDYKWAKEASAFYKHVGKISDDQENGLKGADYYSKLAKGYEEELRKQIPKNILKKIDETIHDEKYWHDLEKWLNAL